MRKRLLYLVLVLVFLPCVLGIANIEGPSKSIFNLGEKINIEGYILETEDMWGLFKIDLICNEKIPLLSKTVSTKANKKYEFTEEVPIPYFVTGNCKIIMGFNVGSNMVEQVESESFSITKDLLGTFEIDENMIQLGDDITINGVITKQNKQRIDGIVTLYFKQNGEIYLIDSVDLKDGEFSYEFDSEDKPAGLYNLEIFATDMFGNEKLFTDISEINLVNEIIIVARPSKESILPGNIISIFGEAKTVLQQKVSKADVMIILDEVQYKTRVSGGEFSQSIKLKSDIKSGKHDVHVIVEDERGNIGEVDTSFNVEVVPTTLEVKVVNGPFKPNDKIIIAPNLYDQASDLIVESINLILFDNKKEEISSGSVETGREIELEIPQFAEPGTWFVVAKASGLETKEEILIGEISNIDFVIDNETLVITNIGNIKFKDYIDIFISGSSGELQINEKVSLKPGAEERINLAYEVDTSGVYDVKVGDKEFSDVKITSQKGLFRYDYLYYLAIVLFVGFLVWLFLFKRKPKVRKKKKFVHKKDEVKDVSELKVDKKKEYAEAFKQMALKNIGEKDKKKFKLFKNKKDAGIVRLDKKHYTKKGKEEKLIKDTLWKNASFKKTSKADRKKFVKESKKDDDSSGMFNMFG